jgi:predicted  nucleic acid-binding Zn-ribbon protein
MSDSQQYEKVSVSSDGVAVDKRFEEDEFPVPAIAFEIQSARSETVTVTLVDRVPEDVAVEDLGFHPEYGSEYWTIDEEQITFERELEAGAEYTTVYGIRATGTDNVEQFLTTPTIESVDPPLEGGDGPVVDEGSSDVVRDVISGDGDVPGLEDDEDADGSDEDVETLNLKDPNEPADAGSNGSGGGDGDDGGSSGGAVAVEDADVDSLVGALAAEIRNQNVDAEDVKLLRKAFDLADDNGGSVDARIQHLQTEVSDLLAYTGALEEFLDENGTGDEMIEEFREQVESFESELEQVREMASGHEQSISEVEETVASVESSMDALQSDMDEVLDDVEAVQSDVDSVQDEVDSVEGTVDEVESDLDDLESQVGDIDVEDVRADIEDIDEEIEELKEWREQLSSVIGGN